MTKKIKNLIFTYDDNNQGGAIRERARSVRKWFMEYKSNCLTVQIRLKQ